MFPNLKVQFFIYLSPQNKPVYIPIIMNKLLIISIISVLSALGACQQNNKAASTSSTEEHSGHAVSDTATAYTAYLSLKDNLVKSDAKAAQASAKQLATPLADIKGCTEATDLAQQIAASGDIKAQRKAFTQLSQDMIPLVKGIKSKGEPIYVQFCPMANEGKGGYWLSAQQEIKNPYYGNEMLECGEVKEEIK